MELEIPFSTESKQRSWWRLWPWEDFKRQTWSSQRTGNQRLEIVNRRRKLKIPFSTESNKDHDGGSDPERTLSLRHRHNHAREREIREQEIWQSSVRLSVDLRSVGPTFCRSLVGRSNFLSIFNRSVGQSYFLFIFGWLVGRSNFLSIFGLSVRLSVYLWSVRLSVYQQSSP